MIFAVNRDIVYLKYSPDSKTIEGLTNYTAVRPDLMSDADFQSVINFFRKIVDETKTDGARYVNEVLMTNNINHFCLKGGTVLFKVVETQYGSGIPELYGFYTLLSSVRTMWIEIDKLCYLLAAETPGSAENGSIDYDMLTAVGFPIFDTKNAMKDVNHKDYIVLL